MKKIFMSLAVALMTAVFFTSCGNDPVTKIIEDTPTSQEQESSVTESTNAFSIVGGSWTYTEYDKNNCVTFKETITFKKSIVDNEGNYEVKDEYFVDADNGYEAGKVVYSDGKYFIDYEAQELTMTSFSSQPMKYTLSSRTPDIIYIMGGMEYKRFN